MDPPERNQQRTRGLRSIMHADCIVILLGGILSIQVEQHLYKSTRTRDQRTKYVFTPALHSLSTRSHQAWPSLIKTLAGCRLGEQEWLWLLLIKINKKGTKQNRAGEQRLKTNKQKNRITLDVPATSSRKYCVVSVPVAGGDMLNACGENMWFLEAETERSKISANYKTTKNVG